MTEKRRISSKEYSEAIEKLAIMIDESGFKPSHIISIARGGLRIGDVLSRLFRVRSSYLGVESYEVAEKGKVSDKQKDEVIERMYQLGRFSSDDNEKLRETINELLTSDKIKHFFSGDWEVKTENEILMENGKTYIPDRLLFSKTTDEIIVIDYKTGIKKDIHETQITEYSDALKLMGMKNVKRVLIYTSDEIKVEYL